MNVDASGRRRLFIAVAVPPGLHDAILTALRPLQRLAPEARWTNPESWHLTVAFLGATPAERVPALDRACAQVAATTTPFLLALDGSAGIFRSGVLWAALRPSVELEQLALATREALLGAGFALEDRPFRAHLTLARARRGERFPRGLAGHYRGPSAEWRVEELALVRSRPLPGGARYTREAVWPLGA